MHNKGMPKLAGRNFRAAGRWPRLASLVGLFSLLLFAAPPARAQDSPIQELASRLATSISASKQKSVIVFDFVGPGGKFTALGTDLADQFSAALAHSAATFTVADRKEIVVTFQEQGSDLRALLETDLARSLAHDLGVQSVVVGQISLKHNNLNILVQAYETENNRRITGLRVSMPFTSEMKNLSAKKTQAENSLENYPKGGKNGYSFATCLRCVNPQFPIETLAGRGKATVVLMVVIGTDGRAGTILVRKWLPGGFTEQTVATVQSWQFRPATGPDGKPATVVMPVEVTFRLY